MFSLARVLHPVPMTRRPSGLRRVCAAAGILLLSAAGCIAAPEQAHADLKVCNKTSSRIVVAVGYKDAKGWATEGWWHIPPDACWSLIEGKLTSRYYYIHAADVDRPGVWDRNETPPANKYEFFMCTKDKAFDIRGVEDCEKRQFNKTRFFEIDTGEETSWVVQLRDKSERSTEQQ